MKTRTFITISILALFLLIIAGNCATLKKPYTPTEDEEFYGTWINPDYNYAAKGSPKLVAHPNGKLEGYAVITDTSTVYLGEFVITNKWTDSKGNIWYSITWKGDEEKYWTYILGKISDSGKTLEYVDSPNDYPKEIDPNDPKAYYRIYYRQ